jgi:hypothetical protein
MGRKQRPHDAHVPDVDREAPLEPGHLGEAPRAAASELVGVHGHLDAARATL